MDGKFVCTGNTTAPFWVEQPTPEFGKSLHADTVSELLNLNTDSLVENLPFQMVTTGLPHFIIPLKSLEALKACSLDLDLYWKLVDETGIRNVLVYAPEGYEAGQQYAVRMFAPALGVDEDPATGSVTAAWPPI